MFIWKILISVNHRCLSCYPSSVHSLARASVPLHFIFLFFDQHSCSVIQFLYAQLLAFQKKKQTTNTYNLFPLRSLQLTVLLLAAYLVFLLEIFQELPDL